MTYSLSYRGLALALVTAVSVIGMPRSASAGGDGLPAGADRQGRTFNGEPLTHLLNTTAVTEWSLDVSEQQGSGQISGVALDAEGNPLADQVIALRVVPEQGGPQVGRSVAATTTSATGGFSFSELSEGRYVVVLLADNQVIATSEPITLAKGGMTFIQVGGIAPSATDNAKGRGGPCGEWRLGL